VLQLSLLDKNTQVSGVWHHWQECDVGGGNAVLQQEGDATGRSVMSWWESDVTGRSDFTGGSVKSLRE